MTKSQVSDGVVRGGGRRKRAAAFAIAGLVIAVVGAAVASAVPVSGVTLDMSSVPLSDTQASGVWYTDRYAPAVFDSFDYAGGKVLRHGIRTADGASLRPPAYSSSFYNTQGRKYDTNLTGPIQVMSIDLVLPSSWSGQDRSCGLWATGFDGSNGVSAYPIVAFRQSGNSPLFASPVASGFYGWDYVNGGYPHFVAVSTFARTYNLKFVLTRGVGTSYFVDGVRIGSIADPDTVSLGNVILNATNFGDEDYDVLWDNFKAGTQADFDTGTDTDRDGLTDWTETYIDHTNPALKDTDGDRIEDGVEVATGTDPLSASSPAVVTDTDKDGIPDAVDTFPASADGDGDGIRDSYELGVNGGLGGTVHLGDANNGGGRPNTADANLLLQIALGRATQTVPDEQLDMNGDGVVNRIDATILTLFALGRIPYIPIR